MSDGATEGEHLEAARQTLERLGKTEAAKRLGEDADAPPFPFALDYLWRMFCEITCGIVANGMAAPALSWEGLRAWQTLTGADLDDWECNALMQLSLARAAAFAPRLPQQDVSNLPRRPDRARR